MAKKETSIADMLDEEAINSTEEQLNEQETEFNFGGEYPTQPKVKRKVEESTELINCLTNERIIVRHVPKETGMITNPKHILYGGMAETAVKSFTVPTLESGALVNVLTNEEKEYLEYIMGLEFNALSIYKKEDNYWSNMLVRLTKQDNYLDLSDPEQYIKYKVLLANKDFIAPSLQVLQDAPKATYQFVIIREGEENSTDRRNMSYTMEAYMEFGKIQDNIATLRTILETIDGRPIAVKTKPDFIQTKVNNLIQADAKLFLKIVKDPLLPTKVLIKESVNAGLLSNRGGFFYLKSDNSPLCESGEDPTFNNAAKYLSAPKNQTLKFGLEAKIKE